MSGQLGAYVTVRYWCPNMFNAGDEKVFGGGRVALVREIVDSEGILGLEDGHEIIAIKIKEQIANESNKSTTGAGLSGAQRRLGQR